MTQTTNRYIAQLLRSDTTLIRDVPPDNTVIFQGDGEPKTPSTMLQRLAEFDQKFALEVDSYSLGGNVEQLETKCAEILGKEAAVFMPTGTPRQPSCHPETLRCQTACDSSGAKSSLQ